MSPNPAILTWPYVAPAGGGVSVRGVAWGSAGSSTSSPSVTSPVAVNSGDVVIALLITKAGRTVTGPSGLGATWSLDYSYLSGSTLYGYHMWYVGTGGSGSGDVSWSLNVGTNCWARAWVVDGITGTLSGANNSATSSSMTHTRTGGGDLLLASGYVSIPQSAGWLTGSGWDSISEADGGGGAAHALNVGSSISITASASSTVGIAATSVFVS